MDKTGYGLVIGWFAFVVLLIGGGVWWGGTLGALVFLVGVVGAIGWLVVVLRLVTALRAG